MPWSAIARFRVRLRRWARNQWLRSRLKPGVAGWYSATTRWHIPRLLTAGRTMRLRSHRYEAPPSTCGRSAGPPDLADGALVPAGGDGAGPGDFSHPGQ